MKVKVELELPDVDIIFQALKVIDPTNIFARGLRDKLATAAKPALEQEKKDK